MTAESLGELDLAVVHHLEDVARGVAEAQPTAGQRLWAGRLEAITHLGSVVDHQPEVDIVSSRRRVALGQGQELVPQVDESHGRNLSAQLVVEHARKELRQPAQHWFVEVYASIFALLEGDLAEAERSLTAAREVGDHAQHWNAAVTYGLQLYALRRLQGRLEEVEALVDRSAEETPSYYIWRCVQAQTAAELGKEQEARDAFAALEGGPLVDLPFNEQLLASASLLSEAAADLGDGERAEALHSILRPYHDRLAICYPEICVGAVARYLGLPATTSERWDDAERFFEEGIEVNARAGAQPWLAHTRRDYAEMLVRRGRPQDRVRSHELLEAAHAGYARLGMDHWAERARP